MSNEQQTSTSLLFWGGITAGVVAVIPGTPIVVFSGIGVFLLLSGVYKTEREAVPDNLRERDTTVWKEYIPVVLLTFISLNLGATRDRLEGMREEYEKRTRINKHLDAFEEAITALGMAGELSSSERTVVVEAVADEAPSPADIERRQVYREATERVYNPEAEHRVEARLVVLFSHEIEQEDSSVAKAAYRGEVDALLSDCSFQTRDDHAEDVLTAYYWLSKEQWKEGAIGDVFEQETPKEDGLVTELLQEYSDRTMFRYVMTNEARAQEFRQTLADLIRVGKVDLASLSQGVIEEKLESIRDEIEEADKQASSYVVMSMELMTFEDTYGAVEAFESKFPQTVRWSGRTVAGNGFPDLRYVSTRVCFTGQSYDSPGEFLEQEIKPLLPPQEEWDDGAFVAVIPFETGKLVSFPDKQTVIEQSDDWYESKVEGNFEAMNLLARSRDALVTNIAVGDVRHEIDIDELLRVIPFNIVAPEIGRDEKHFIQSNYEALKGEFSEVNTLFDWGIVSSDALARELETLDSDGIRDDWTPVAEDILDGVRDCAEAGMIETLSKG